MPLIEVFGYLGSALIVLSMLLPSVVKLRVINTIGCTISGIYTLIIGSYPMALMNICLVIINVYNLRKLLITRNRYDLVACDFQDSTVKFFLDYYQDDIKIYFPEFHGINPTMNYVYLIFCNAQPAGILVGNYIGNNTIQIYLEYTTPSYRDCSIGKYLYSELKAKGVEAFIMKNPSFKHVSYLTEMGYKFEDPYFIKRMK